MRTTDSLEALLNKAKHGPRLVNADAQGLTISIQGHPNIDPYRIAAGRYETPLQALDWLHQISEKKWATAELQRELIAFFFHRFKAGGAATGTPDRNNRK